MYRRVSQHTDAHKDSVWAVAWAPLNRVVTGSLDETAKVWGLVGAAAGTDAGDGGAGDAGAGDSSDFRQVASLDGHQLGVVSTSLHPTGNLLATTCIDCRLRIFDVSKPGDEFGALEKEIDAGPVEAWGASFSGLTKHVATGSRRGAVNIWSYEKASEGADEGEDAGPAASLDTGGDFVMGVNYSTGSQWIGAGCNSGLVSVFDVEQKKQIMKNATTHAMPVRSVAFSKDDKLLLSASDDQHVAIFDPRQGQAVTTLAGHSSWVLDVSLSPDGRRFATASADHTVKIWDLGVRRCLHTFDDHSDQVWSVAYNRTGTRLATGADDGSLSIYQVEV